MRKLNPIDSLFPKIRQGILANFFDQPDKWWYLSELAGQMETSPSSLQRELVSLSESGILQKRRDGNRLYYKAETDSPFYPSLRELIRQTMGVIPALKALLTEFEGEIKIAFIYGSVARREEHTLSDVDVIIIGSIELANIAFKIRDLEKKFAREISLKCYNPKEFTKKLKASNHFLTSVMNDKKIFIRGNKDELAGLIK
jgi:predicted nucleotidyltransferase